MNSTKPKMDDPTKIDHYISRKSPSDIAFDKYVLRTYLVYTIFWESLVWIGGTFLILYCGWPYYMLVGLIILSMTQIPPAKWRMLIQHQRQPDIM